MSRRKQRKERQRRFETADARKLEVEQSQVIERRCDCCGAGRTVVTGFVHRKDGDTLASYVASLYPAGPTHEHEAFIDVTLGTWGRDDYEEDHVTFGAWCKVGKGCMLVDGASAAPDDSPLLGYRLTREEGLAHRLVNQFWDVIDAVLTEDPTVSCFYCCGD